MIKNVIFDWSGTLSNNLHSFQYVCRSVFQKYGIPEISLDEIRQNFDTPYMKFWNKYLPEYSKDEQDELYAKLIHEAEPAFLYEGVKETMQNLKNKNIRMFIISSDPLSKLYEEIKTGGLSDYFEEILGKIHEKEDVIPKIVDKYLLNNSETYYIGDTCGDIEAGKKSEIGTVAISWGYQHREILKKSNPDYLIDKITELKNII
jgi:phosphoglycolate phosphatase